MEYPANVIGKPRHSISCMQYGIQHTRETNREFFLLPLWISVYTLSLTIYGMPVCQLWKYGHSFVLHSIWGSLSVQCSSVTQSCPILWEPMDCQMPGFPVHHQLPEFTHVHWVRDSVQSFHPLLAPFPPAFTVSQHQGLFPWVSFSLQVAKLVDFQLQPESFQTLVRTDFL